MGSYHPIRPSRLNSGCLFLLLFLGEFCSFLNLGQKMRGFLISILINQLKNSLAPRDLQYQIQSSDCHIAAQIVFMSLYSSQKHRQQINTPSTPPVTTWKKKMYLESLVFDLNVFFAAPQYMKTRMYEESDPNLQRKALLAGP